MITVGIKKLNPDAQLPKFAKDGDVCADIHAIEEITLSPGTQALVGTGFAMQLPCGYEAQIRPRSGLAAKHSLTITNAPGTIDEGYRGEVKVILHNLGNATYVVQKGERIAQMAIREVPQVEFKELIELTETQRGNGGFGSTGKI